MITRFTRIEGTISPGREEAFRSAVSNSLVPSRSQFPGATGVSATGGSSRDEGAWEFPPVLAITYPGIDTMSSALNSDACCQPKAVTREIVDASFDGRIPHHVTESSRYSPSPY